MVKPVARLNDKSSHGGYISSATSSMTADNLKVALVGDNHFCPLHGQNKIITGSASVSETGKKYATVGSQTTCGAVIITGSPSTNMADPG